MQCKENWKAHSAIYPGLEEGKKVGVVHVWKVDLRAQGLLWKGQFEATVFNLMGTGPDEETSRGTYKSLWLERWKRKQNNKWKENGAAPGLGAFLGFQSGGAQSRLWFLLPASFSDTGYVNSDSHQSVRWMGLRHAVFDEVSGCNLNLGLTEVRKTGMGTTPKRVGDIAHVIGEMWWTPRFEEADWGRSTERIHHMVAVKGRGRFKNKWLNYEWKIVQSGF